MQKANTRVVRRTSISSLNAAGEDVMKVDSSNFETPVSSSEPVPLRPLQLGTTKMTKKTLFKSPRKDSKRNYHLGVTYNIRQSGQGVPSPVGTPSSLQPFGTCRKCKHINLNHGYIKRRFLNKKAKSKSGKSSDSKKKSASSPGKQIKGFSTPEPRKNEDCDSSFFLDCNNSITQQIKETIAISPYVRNYLERKLKDQLKRQGKEGSTLWQQSIKGLKFSQSANLDELELVINLEQMAEGDTDAIPKEEEKPVDIPVPAIKGKTYDVHRRPLHELVGKEAQLRTSKDGQKATVVSKMAGKENKMPPPEPAKYQYFTRFKARTLKGHPATTTAQSTQPNALSVFSCSTDVKMTAKQPKQRFVPPKTITTRTMVKTKAAPVAISAAPAVVQSTCPRFTRKCKTLAGNELISCGAKVIPKHVAGEGARAGVTTTTTATRVLPIRASMAPTAMKTRMARKSSIPVFTGVTKKTAFK